LANIFGDSIEETTMRPNPQAELAELFKAADVDDSKVGADVKAILMPPCIFCVENHE
jgi:hypothetical protein